jgi:hypothetical protein
MLTCEQCGATDDPEDGLSVHTYHRRVARQTHWSPAEDESRDLCDTCVDQADDRAAQLADGPDPDRRHDDDL